MRRTTPATRAVRVALMCFTLIAVLGFAAEPSTSTQYDVLEGRGVAVVQAGHQLVAHAHVADDRPDPVPVVPVLLVLVAMGLTAVALVRRAHDAGGRLPSSPGRSLLARRGPPALV